MLKQNIHVVARSVIQDAKKDNNFKGYLSANLVDRFDNKECIGKFKNRISRKCNMQL